MSMVQYCCTHPCSHPQSGWNIIWWHGTPIPWPNHTLWWHPHSGQTIYYGDTHTQVGPYIMVTPASWPNHALWWHPHSGWTIHYGDTHTLVGPYYMVTPTLRLEHILCWHPYSGPTTFYGDTHTLARPYITATPYSLAWPQLAHKLWPIVNPSCP